MERMSMTLTGRIAEAERAIADLEARLEGIVDERTTLLGAAALDLKSTHRLDDCEQKVRSALAAQRDRVTVLQSQIEAAEHTEAGDRIGAIEGEHQLIRLRCETRYHAWTAGIEALLAVLKETAVDKAQVRVLAEEAAFLVERYGTPHATLPHALFPSQDDLATTLAGEFRKAALALLVTSPWKEKTDQVRQQRNVAVAAGRDPRRVVRSQIVTSRPVTFAQGKV